MQQPPSVPTSLALYVLAFTLCQVRCSPALAESHSSLQKTLDAQRSSRSTTGPPPFRMHSAVHAPAWLLLNGSQRIRYAMLSNQFRPGLDRQDQVLAIRTLLTLGLVVGDVTFACEMQDARAYLTDTSSALSTIMVNTVEPLQAYGSIHFDEVLSEGDALDMRLGRQTLDLGARRLVARNSFRNTIQGYTGLTTQWQSAAGHSLFLLATLPIRITPGNDDRNGLLRNRIALDRESFDLLFWGAFYQQPLPQRLNLEVYFFGLNERDSRTYASRNRQLYTPGVRLSRSPAKGDWDLDLESVVQVGQRHGSVDADDHDAHPVLTHFHHAAAGYTLALPWTPRLSAELDYGSGDRASSDRDERFDSLFGPRRADFGPTDIYGPLGRENIVSTGVRFGVNLSETLDGFLSYRANWLASASDAFARTAIRDESRRSGSFAGHQFETRARLWIIQESLLWELGGAFFVKGRFLREAPNATPFGYPLFAYTDLAWVF